MHGTGYRWWGMLFALCGVVGFSFRPILVKLSYAAYPVSPVTLLFLRMALAFPVFLGVAWWLSRQSRVVIGPRDWAGIAGLGFIGYYLASFLDMIGLQYIGAGIGRLILFLYPTLVVLLSLVFLGRRPTRRELTALAVTYAGIALVLSSHFGAGAGGRLFLFGVLLVFASAVCYAVYLVAGSQITLRIGSMRFTAYTMIVSTLPAVAQFVATEPLAALELPAAVWWYAVLMAAFATALPVFLVAEALRRIGANHFALIGAFGPVTTAAVGAIGLDEPFTLLQSAGSALVIAGVLLVSLKPKAT